MDGIPDRRQKKKTRAERGDSKLKEPEIEIDWGNEFAVFATVYGWRPEVVVNLTLAQFEAYQKFAYEHLAKKEIAGGIAEMFGSPRTKSTSAGTVSMNDGDQTDQFAAAALRLKKKMGVKDNEKVKIPIDKVWDEVKRGN